MALVCLNFSQDVWSNRIVMVGSQTAEQGGDFRLTRPIREKGDGENRNCNQLSFETQKTEFWLLKISVAAKIVQFKHGGRCKTQFELWIPFARMWWRKREPLLKSGSCHGSKGAWSVEESHFWTRLANVVDQQLSIILLINFKQLFPAATLSIFSGSRCLHEVTKVDGERDRFQQSWKTPQSSHLIFRFVAVFCFSTKAGVKNSAKVNNVCKSNWSNHFSLFRSFLC